MENRTELAPFATAFPVIFFNGNTDDYKGIILVYPYLLFPSFRALVSQKLGIPPLQILTYLVRWKDVRSSPAIRFKVPIDESSDFTAIVKERDCFVLAILNPSMTNRLILSGEQGKAIAVEEETIVPEKTSLKRFPANASNVDVPVAVGLQHWNYESQLQDMQRGMHLMFREEAYAPLKAADTETETATSSTASSVVCEECAAAKKEGRSANFHTCACSTRWL